MNRNLAVLLPEVVDELDVAFQDVFDHNIRSEGLSIVLFCYVTMHGSNATMTDWTPLKVVDLALHVVVRSSNRAFVGLPTCKVLCLLTWFTLIPCATGRIDNFCAVNTQFAVNVMIGSFFINLFPEFLKPYAPYVIIILLILTCITVRTVGTIFTTVSGHQRKVLKYLGPIIEERKAKIAEYGPEPVRTPTNFTAQSIHFEALPITLE